MSEERKMYETLALNEHAAYLGKLLTVTYLLGYEKNDSAEIQLTKPAIVRVVETPEGSILHWNCEWLDPYWDVELVEGPPEAHRLRTTWIDGPSYNSKTGERTWEGVRPFTGSRLLLAVRRFFGARREAKGNRQPRSVNSTRANIKCDVCGHSAESHYHEDRGYEECRIAGCPCSWFSCDSTIWDNSR